MNRRGFLLGGAGFALAGQEKDDGYRGIWYFNQPSNDRYVYKYSGGFATYPQQHAPIAIYSAPARKTFFCYGGRLKEKNELLHMVSYFDHAPGTVPRPTILLNKRTNDAHDNPTLSLDARGHVWIFSSAHGTSRPSFIHRSREPYSIDAFERVSETNFSYTQPWHLGAQGFLLLHTRYRQGNRALFAMNSADGAAWSEPRELAFAERGHYQVSWPDAGRGRIGTVFDIHPAPGGLNYRTNLYYMSSADGGHTWQTAGGEPVTVPVRAERNPALVRDYRSEGLLVYLKDIQYDAQGHPVIVYLTSKGYESGPQSVQRTLWAACWTGKTWRYNNITVTDHNYDHGSLYLEGRRWRYLSPSGPGPQPWSTGGEMEAWESRDDGQTWKRAAQLTRRSRYNHTYLRRPLYAHQDFYALWADGNPLEESESSLYFATRDNKVFRLPPVMTGDSARPERIH